MINEKAQSQVQMLQMPLAKKLQIPEGTKVCVMNPPSGFHADFPTMGDVHQDPVLLFVKEARELESRGKPVIEAAKKDQLVWIAYPKAGQMGTDLNRDIIWELLKPHGIRPVRLVSLDDKWSAIRFRPG